MEALKLEPLTGPSLPAAVAALAGSAGPAKLMAVRGMAPLRPADLLVAIYQLSFDTDPAVKSAAEAAPDKLPDKVLLAPLAERLPAEVLHFFAERLPSHRKPPIEKILYNIATADDTFVSLAKRLDEDGLEIIFQNEVRLLRCPALVEALYFNKNARMSSVSRALELCVRNHVRADGIPGFDELAASILSDPNAATPSHPDESLKAAISEAETLAAAEVLDAVAMSKSAASSGASSESAPDDKKKNSAIIKFDELKIFEKVRLATVGNAYCRSVLVRDTNKVVAMAVIRSPSISDMEVVAFASNRSICEDVIRYIANSRVYTKDYAVKQALVNNPKCPLALSIRLLNFLRPDDLRMLSRSKNVPGALSTAAKKLLETRTKSGAG